MSATAPAPRATAASYDVLIVGGGMVGASLACALGDSGLKIAVIEQHPPPPAVPAPGVDPRVSALTLATRALFERLGAWDGVARRGAAMIQAMRVWDAAGRGEIRFDAADIGEPCLAYVAENGAILSALLDRVAQCANVHYGCPAAIAGVDVAEEEAGVTFADGRRWRARLLVGADGADSLVRRGAGIAVRRFPFHQDGIVATVTVERPHEDVARQRFLPTGPLALLPLPDAHTVALVWSAGAARARSLRAADDAAFAAAIEDASERALGRILAVGPRAAFPLSAAHAVTYTGARVVLIGDAAHTVHPLAGQGVNLGFLDAAALAQVVLDAVRRGRDIGGAGVRRRYERWRKGENLAMLAVTAGLGFLFGTRLPGVAAARGAGLRLTDAAVPFKRLIMRRASGLAGDLPRLARREDGVRA